MAREMKDSGIEWIGEIPKDWDIVRMKSCITQRDSGAWGEDATGEEGDAICLRIADFNYSLFRFKDTPINSLTKRHYSLDVIEKLLLQKNDILIEKSGGGEKTPVGRTIIFDKDYPALFSNFMDRLRCANFINPMFMQYVFVTFYKNEYTRNYIKQTTGIQNLDLTSMLSQEKVPLPSLDEQQKIVDFLDKKCAEIDSVIEKTKATIEEYKKLKQSIITKAVTKGIRPNCPMKNSGIEWMGEIPVDWKTIKNKHCLLDVYSGGTPSSGNSSFYDDNGIPFVTIADMSKNDIVNHTKTCVSQLGLLDKNLKILPKGTLLYSIYATIGAVSELNIEATINQAILALRPDEKIFNKKYYKYSLCAMKDYVLFYASKNTQNNLNAEKVKNFIFACPPLSVQKSIVDYLDKKCAEISTLIEKKIALLAEMEAYKKSIIYECMTGKKTV